MASAALRVKVVQRVRISSVLGLGGTLGALEAVSLPLDVTDPELSELVLEPRRSEMPRSGPLCPLPVALTPDCCHASSFKLESDPLPVLEERLEKLRSVLVLLMLRARLSGTELSFTIGVCVQVSERTSRDLALWRRPGKPLD